MMSLQSTEQKEASGPNEQQPSTPTGPDENKSEKKPIVTHLLLIRHGENDWVKSNKLAGRTPDVHLNERGRQQAANLAGLLHNQPIRTIYSSPLERCVETATPLAERLSLPVTHEPGVLEVDYGEWRGADLKELAKQPAWHLVQHYPSSFRFPSGETLYEVQSRAVHTLDRIRQTQAGQTVAVFSHGDVIRLSLAHFLGVPIDLFQRVLISTASISVVVFHDSVPSVLAMNVLTELPIFEQK